MKKLSSGSKACEKKHRRCCLKKVPRRYHREAKGIFDYEDTLVICVKYHPASLLEIKRIDYYYDFMNIVGDGIGYPPELEKAEKFFERTVTEVFDEYGFGYAFAGGGEGSCAPLLEVDFKRHYVYDKWFRMVMILDRKFSLSPFCKTRNKWNLPWIDIRDENEEPECIYVNGKKIKTYDALEIVIRGWLEKLKRETDSVNKDVP